MTISLNFMDAPPARALATGQNRQKTGKTFLLLPLARSGRMGPQ